MKTFLRYASLNTLGMLGLSLYILADTFFIAADMGADGLAALNLAIPVYSLIHGMGLLLGAGGATRYTFLKEQGRAKDADAAFTHSLFSAWGCGLICLLMGLTLSRTFAGCLGAEGDVLLMTDTYLKVILLFAPGFMTNQVMLAFVRNDGGPQFALWGMLAGSFGNIILDYVFIFPLGMGILGAVIATGLAPLISLAVLSPFFLKKRNTFSLCRCRPALKTLRRITALGLPSLITELSSAVVMFLFNALMLSLCGSTGVAAYGVVANLALVVSALYTGVAQGMQPLASRAYSRGETTRPLLRCGLGTVLTLSALIYTALFLNSEGAASLFNSQGNAALQALAVQGLQLYFIGCPFAGCNILFSLYFPAVDKPAQGQTASLMRTLLLIPFAFAGASLWGVTGLWLSFPLAEAATLCVSCALFKKST